MTQWFKRAGSWTLALAVAAGVMALPGAPTQAALNMATQYTAPTAAYTDMSQVPDWALNDVNLATQLGIFRGDDTGTFRPNDQISRAEFTAILMRAFQLKRDYDAEVPFTDTADGWYKSVIKRAVQTGVILPSDYGTRFEPNRPITRAEMARMVARAVDARGVTFTPGPVMQFGDVPTSHPFYADITKAARYGIINGLGNGNFGPQDTATRAQAAAMIGRAIRLGEPLAPDADPSIGAGGQGRSASLPWELTVPAAWEIALRREPGTAVRLDDYFEEWLSTDAQIKLEEILTRDVQPGQRMGVVQWHGTGVSYIGPDYAIVSGELDGVGTISIPVQRQLDGHWMVLSIPFDRFDASKVPAPDADDVVFSYTDWTTDTTFYGYNLTDGVEAVMNLYNSRPKAAGYYRIVRIGGLPWEQTAYKAAVEEFHTRSKDPETLHRIVRLEGSDVIVQTFNDEEEFVATAMHYSMTSPVTIFVDGIPFSAFEETPFYRNLVQRGNPQALEEVVRANPSQYVPQFLAMLDEVRNAKD